MPMQPTRALARLAENPVFSALDRTQLAHLLEHSQLRNLQRVRQTRAEQVALMVEEDLRLVDQPAKGGGMDDAVTVTLVFGTGRRSELFMAPPACRGRITGKGGKRHVAIQIGT